MENTELSREELLASFSTEEIRFELEKRLEPSEDALKASKEQKGKGFDPTYIRIGTEEFLYRGLKRKEWREQLKKQNQAIVDAGEDLTAIAEAKEDAKEDMVNSALLWKGSDREIMAGAVELLADAVLAESGFGPPETEPTKL